MESTASQQILTLIDALNLAYAVQRHTMVDTARLKRSLAVAAQACQAFGEYEIIPLGKVVKTRRCHYMVVKYDKQGNREASYRINLNRENACDCPDVVQNGVINCKHVIGVVLWQAAHDIYNQQIRDN